MTSIFRRAFNTETPYWRAIPVLGILAIVPSVGLIIIISIVFQALGTDPASYSPEIGIDVPLSFGLVVIVAPILETFILMFGLWLLGFLVKPPTARSAVSSVLWGAAHGIQAPLWFFGTFWSFFVFSRGYMAWREVSWFHAFGAACLPHAMQNAFALTLAGLAV